MRFSSIGEREKRNIFHMGVKNENLSVVDAF